MEETGHEEKGLDCCRYAGRFCFRKSWYQGSPGHCAPRGRKAAHFDGTVIFTLDTHGADYLKTQEGRILPVPHCIKGTAGHRLVPELENLAERLGAEKVEKEAFGSLALAGKLEKVRDTIESVELVGLCTDICVVSNALIIKAALPEVPVLVDSHCCAGVTPHSHGAALETMRSSQVKIL